MTNTQEASPSHFSNERLKIKLISMLAYNQFIHVNIKLHVYRTSSYYLSISDYKQF